MKAKYWVLVAIVTGLVGWAGLETQRLVVAKKQLEASLQLEKATTQRAQIASLNRGQGLAGKK